MLKQAILDIIVCANDDKRLGNSTGRLYINIENGTAILYTTEQDKTANIVKALQQLKGWVA